MEIKSNGKLSVEIFKVYEDYHLLTDEEKYDILLLLKQWVENELSYFE